MFLVLALFLISACNQAVGKRVGVKKIVDEGPRVYYNQTNTTISNWSNYTNPNPSLNYTNTTNPWINVSNYSKTKNTAYGY